MEVKKTFEEPKVDQPVVKNLTLLQVIALFINGKIDAS